MDDDPPPKDLLLAEVGRYARLSEARERGLVVSAMELPHWIIREGNEFVLRVELSAQAVVASELGKYEAEHRSSVQARMSEPPAERISTLSLYVAGWILSGFWLAQNLLPEWWMERGEAVSERIMRGGEWWRCITALTLHGDLAHLVANLATGLLFAGFAIGRFGSGITWFGIVLTGALGNLINASFYRSESHISIGASTAVFGALGLLVGGEFVARLGAAHTRGRWQLILPLGAGLALLAYLGVGDEQKHIDYMAHLWGFLSGIALGAVLAGLRVKERSGTNLQRAAAVAAPALVAIAWCLALR